MAEAVRAFLFAYWMAVPGSDYAHAAALMQHAYDETRFSPCVVNPSSSASGIYQWLGERRYELAQFAGTRACPSLKTQLDFANWELHRPPYNAFWRIPGGRAYSFLRQCFGYGRC